MCTVLYYDDGQRDCPKHVKLHSKNKFEKLVHLVGFVIRINFSSLLLVTTIKRLVRRVEDAGCTTDVSTVHD